MGAHHLELTLIGSEHVAERTWPLAEPEHQTEVREYVATNTPGAQRCCVLLAQSERNGSSEFMESDTRCYENGGEHAVFCLFG